MKYKSIAALLSVLLLLLSLTACGGEAGETLEEDAPAAGIAVQVEEIVSGGIAAESTVSGQIAVEEQTPVMVAANAKCTAVYFEAGDEVKVGDALCTLDLSSTLSSYNAASISYRSSVQSYNDQAAVFEKQIALLEKSVSDLKELFEIGAASQLEIDQAELQLQTTIVQRDSTLSQLEAGMQSALSNVEQLDTVLENVDSRGNVIAPVSGVLTVLSAVENGFVSSASPVAVIDGVAQLKISVQVSEALVPKLSAGDTASVTVSAAEQSFDTLIRSVDQTANPQTRLYTVTLSVPADVEGLLAGMFADVTFHTDVSENTIVIPTQAILTRGETQYVFVAEGETARYTEVTTGLTGNGVTEILSGLTAGQRLVTVGQAYLNDGDPVRIVSGADAPADASTDAEAGGGAAPEDGSEPSGEE